MCATNLYHVAFVGAADFFFFYSHRGISSEQSYTRRTETRYTSAMYVYVYKFEKFLYSFESAAVFSDGDVTSQVFYLCGRIFYLCPGPVPLNGTNRLNCHSLSKYTHLRNNNTHTRDDTI